MIARSNKRKLIKQIRNHSPLTTNYRFKTVTKKKKTNRTKPKKRK